jgi:predicted small secreted protein
MTILKILGLFALLGSFAVATTGCENTARGIGADMEQAGQDLQNLDND